MHNTFIIAKFTKSLLKKEDLLIDQHYKKYLEAFAENLFVGVSNFSKDGYDSASALACNIAKNNIKAVAINDVLLEKEDHLAHQAKVAINNATLLKDEIDNPNVSSEQYFKAEEELAKFHELEPLKNTFEVANYAMFF